MARFGWRVPDNEKPSVRWQLSTGQRPSNQAGTEPNVMGEGRA